MANQEHLDLLKQGVDTWNKWRQKHLNIRPDLSRADLSETKLSGVDFSRTNLSGTNLNRADLSGANFLLAFLDNADLHGANLSNANLTETSLSGADLRSAILSFATFNLTHLKDANLREATVGSTIFVDIDLSQAKGLETIEHEFPSSVGIDTIYRSQGNIPEDFLRGAGVPEIFLAYMHSLVSRPTDYYTCFISYSIEDQDFVSRLYRDLQSEGIRCWFALEEVKIGNRIQKRIDESIQSYDKLLFVVSKNSMRSPWVRYEVENALKKERKSNQTVLFPIRLDDALPSSTQDWTAPVLQRRMVDFSHWRDSDQYQRSLFRLIKELQIAAVEIDEDYKKGRADDR